MKSVSAVQTDVALLWHWAQQGWLSRMDAAFAQWVLEQAALHPQPAHPALHWVAAVLSALQTRGHSCLPIAQLGDARQSFQHLGQMLGWAQHATAEAAQAGHPQENHPQENHPQTSLAQESQADEGAVALRTLCQHLPATPADWLAALQSPLVQALDAQHLPEAEAETDNDADASALTLLDTPAPPLVLHLGRRHGQAVPLRLYLRRYHAMEQVVARSLLARARRCVPLHLPRVQEVLTMLFQPTPAAAVAATASAADAPLDWQRAACALALRRHLSVITGGPGTGRIYTAARLMAAALALAPEPASVRIRLAAPTGKAAARLSESLQQALGTMTHLPDPLRQALARIAPARTLHALLGARQGTRALQHHAGNPLALDWLLVDEASMIDLPMMAALLQALPANARLVLLGDKDQLASVEAGAVLGDLCQGADQGQYSPASAQYLQATCGQRLPERYTAPPICPPPLLAQATIMLRQSRRFGSAIGRLAHAVQQGDAHALAQALQNSAGALAANPSADGIHNSATALRWKERASLRDALPLIQGSAALPGYGALAQAVQDAPAWLRAMHACRQASPAEAESPYASTDASAQQQHEHAAWVWSVLAQLARFRILCATREGPWGVEGMNALVLQQLGSAGVPTRAGWFAGRAVMVTRNDANLGVFNGDVGITLPSPSGALRVYFPAAEPAQTTTWPDSASTPRPSLPPLRSYSVSRMQYVHTAFAMTVHKSQGSEFDHILLCLDEHSGPLLTRELLYTGLTRARTHLSYLAPVAGLWSQAMHSRTRRASGLAELLHHASDNAPPP